MRDILFRLSTLNQENYKLGETQMRFKTNCLGNIVSEDNLKQKKLYGRQRRNETSVVIY